MTKINLDNLSNKETHNATHEPMWFNKPSAQPVQNKRVETEVKEIHIGERSPYKVMVCTPVHGDVSMHYVQAVLKFQQACMMKNMLCSFTLLKSSLVTQGRNLCVADFINHEDNYTHLLFIDSDIDFEAKTIFKMLELEKDLIACPYSMKTLDFNKMWRRLQKEKIDNPDHLMKAGFTFPIKVPDPESVIVEKGVMKATHAPTGCMLIKRNVIEKLMKAHPELKIFQPTIINGVEHEKENFYNLFDTLHDPKTKKYFGEDFGFCQRWTDIGGEIYLYIMDYITHVGEYQYCGRFWDELLHVKRIDDPSKIK
tara:strand:- start:704 stop:1636 length:933 start_codon:yes stop_codon:yes gene_type:complete